MLVIGQGPIGLILSVLARRTGARVITSDLYSQRLTISESFGLGLTIAGEIVNEYYAGDLELLDSGPLPGATFRITLRSRV